MRDDLEKNGIAGTRAEGGAYYRFVRDVNIRDPESKQKILNIVDILHKQAYAHTNLIIIGGGKSPGGPREC